MLSYVYAYTFDFGDPNKAEDNPYYKINRGLLVGSFDSLIPIQDLVYGLLSGLRTLPYKKFPLLYRGIKTNIAWEMNKPKLWPSFISTTPFLFSCGA